MWVTIDNDKEMDGLLTFLKEPAFSCVREFVENEKHLLPCQVFLDTEYVKPEIVSFAPLRPNRMDVISFKEFLRGQKEIFSKKLAKGLHI